MKIATVACLLVGFVQWEALAQPAPSLLQHPGSICCNQTICPFLPLGQINQDLATTPPPSDINVEYTWHVLVDDTTTTSGTKWIKIPNSNAVSYQPTQIMSQFGGFYMRGVRLVGTLPYLFSNVVNIKILSASNPDCASVTDEVAVQQQVMVSPNPATDQLRVVATDPSNEIVAYRVFGLDGRLHCQADVSATPALTVPVSSLPSGLYFLQIDFSGGKTWVNKWVKF